MKKIAGDIVILQLCTKNHNHMKIQFLRYRVRQNFVIFCHASPRPTPPNNLENHNFEKMKKASGDVIILNLCNKKHDHDVCLLRYGVQQTIFCHLKPVLLFYPTIDPKN